MNKRQVENYFKILDQLYGKRCRIILTGAAAGALYGRVRATMDVDFALPRADWQSFAAAVEQAKRRTRISAQYTEDIDRWSAITYLDYERHTYVYRKFDKIELRLMEPAYWALGKLTRYLDSDVRDLVSVLAKTSTHWKDVAGVAGRALKQSPKSTACFQFRTQVENFFAKKGKKVWGKNFDFKKAVELFHQKAGVQT